MSDERQVGLCVHCRHAAVQRNARGGSFWRCLRADEDTHFLRYPPLPVLRCPGYEEGSPQRGSAR